MQVADETWTSPTTPGLELKARSQWGYAMRRFLRHRLAMGSLVVLLFLGVVAIFADFFAPYAFDEPDFLSITLPPTTEGKHYFGTDFLGRDTLQPGHLRAADVALGGARGLPARDGDRDDDRRRSPATSAAGSTTG